MEKIWSNKFARASGRDKRVMFPGAQSWPERGQSIDDATSGPELHIRHVDL